GTVNPATGQVATPRVVTRGNGTARIGVVGVAADNFTIVANDSFTVTVRQVARRVAVEPLRGLLTAQDSIPIRPVARDARGAAIPDATIDVTASGIPVHGIWAGPIPIPLLTFTGTITPNLNGTSLPS